MPGRPGMGGHRRTGRSAEQQQGSAAFTYVMKAWEELSDEERLAPLALSSPARHFPITICSGNHPGQPPCIILLRGMNYAVRRANAAPPLLTEWSDAGWEQADTLEIQYFRPESNDHHPRTSARLLYDALGFSGSRGSTRCRPPSGRRSGPAPRCRRTLSRR
jgi:hypothetical protein